MAITDDLVQLLNRLRTDTGLQATFLSNPSAALQSYQLTGHERDAVITRDLDDLVAIGAAASIADLPGVLRGERADRPLGGGGWLSRQVEALRQAMRGLIERRPIPGRPEVPRPRPRPGPPRPEPRPGPDPPRPGPRPGPDPPGPDV
jgi:hypothetical protein